jgi:hypothetical protein
MKRLVDNDYLITFDRLLDYEVIDIKEITIWALGNIISVTDNLESFLSTSILSKIFNLAETKAMQLIRVIASFFKNLAVPDAKLSDEMLYNIIDIFSNYIYHNETGIISECLWGLANISDMDVDMNRFVPLIDRIVSIDYMKMDKGDVTAILLMIGNISASIDKTELENLYKDGIYDYLEAMLFNINDKNVKTKILWVTSNICHNSNIMIEKLLESNFSNQVIKLLDNPIQNVRKEALYVIANIVDNKHFSHSHKLVAKGLYIELISIMNNIYDKEILKHVIFILENIFSSAEVFRDISGDNPLVKKFEDIGGVDCLEKLHNHYCHDIYKQSEELFNKYFNNKNI